MRYPATEPSPRTTALPPRADRYELVRTLERLGREDLPIAGGKGASLGAMVRAELPVPEGFVVLTGAYRAFVEHNDLQAEIRRLADGASADDLEALHGSSRAIQHRFETAELPAELAQAITTAYGELGGGPVAVRSSATAEDLPGASFAGQHDSYLHVEGDGAVVEAVRRCFASLWNPRAMAYRQRQGIGSEGVAMAVVVQRMIDAERAGVLFTANPLNHRRDRMLLNASWGIGEAVVAGEVTPDEWVVDAGSGRVLETRIADKRVITVREGDGTATREMPAELREKPTLQPDEVEELARMGRAAETYFAAPQDLEWAAADGRFYLVQSRPITALFPLPEPLPDPADGLRLYLCVSVHAQQMLEPLTPMGLEFWRVLVAGFGYLFTGKPYRRVPALKTAAGRLFFDVTTLLRNPKRWDGFATAISDKDPVTPETLKLFLARDGDGIAHRGPGIRIPLRMIPLAARLGLRYLGATISPERARNRLQRETDAAIGALEKEADSLSGVADRVRFLEEEIGRRGAHAWLVPVAVMAPGLNAEGAIRTRLERWLGDASGMVPIQRALPHNPTTEMGIALWRLARHLQAAGVEPTADHPAVNRFLARFGHRAVWEIDPGVARWAEDPTYVLEVLRSYGAAQGVIDQEAQFHAHAAEAERTATELVERVRREKGRPAARRLRRLIRLYRETGGMREQPKFDGARIVALTRRVLREAGEVLVERGRLDHADDVFFLTLDDLRAADEATAGEAGIDLRERAAEAREEYRRERERRAVPRWVTSTGECLFGVPAPETEGVLTGFPVSPGTHEGTVRVILHPTGARLERGEVLVCRGTDPCWTPLFLNAGALVMETGGTVSHGSVVAREYGLPAVAGVADATERLRDGMRVRVDGETGQITVLD
jgi:rifampicin phosphotransferase